jgi:signal transduction histidine kinase
MKRLGWAAPLPLVTLIFTVYWGVRPWTLTIAIMATAVTLLAPAIAADLLPVFLIGLGSVALALTGRHDQMPMGSPSSHNYPLHTWVFGQGWPSWSSMFDLTAGIVMLGSAAWLVPRTIGAHTALAQRNRELLGRVRKLTATRTDATDTAAAELRRLERDLHDGAQARLVALGISLRATESLIKTNPDAAIALVAESRENSAKALAELRDLVRGINPPVLEERGLADAVEALALDTATPVTTDIGMPGRAPQPVEAAVYFAIAEALANAVKHAGASHIHITLKHDGNALRAQIIDDGTGGATPASGTGLAGIERRLATFDGILAVSSPPGGPTIIAIEVPCALSSRKTSSC